MQPSPRPNATYQCYSGSPDPGESMDSYTQRCIQLFRVRHHAEPEQAFLFNRMLWIGPLPSKDDQKKDSHIVKPGGASWQPVQLNLFQEGS